MRAWGKSERAKQRKCSQYLLFCFLWVERRRASIAMLHHTAAREQAEVEGSGCEILITSLCNFSSPSIKIKRIASTFKSDTLAGYCNTQVCSIYQSTVQCRYVHMCILLHAL